MTSASYVISKERMAEIIADEKRDTAVQAAIFRVLLAARGAKLSTDEIGRAIGFDPCAEENWDRMCQIIWWCTTLVRDHKIQKDYRAETADAVYFIPVPVERAHG